jgi:hypothetical protein
VVGLGEAAVIEPKFAPKTPFKPGRPIGVVVHTTGAGLVRKAAELGIPPMVRAVQLYRNLQAEGPHWVIDQAGNREQIQLTDRVAYHVGGLRHARLAAPLVQAEYAWWRERFPAYKKLLDMPMWWAGSVNNVAWGVEVIPHEDPYAPWSDACVGSLHTLLWDLARTFKAVRGVTVCTHSELSPYTRTAKGKPWDLTPTHSAQLDDIVARL